MDGKDTKNSKFTENFERIRVLGRGAYGLCYLCRDLRNPLRPKGTPSDLRPKVVVKKVSLECRQEEERKAILRITIDFYKKQFIRKVY
jgi:hypothetical protein